jgi:hypothetical protein
MGTVFIHAGDFMESRKHRFTKRGFEYEQPPKLTGIVGGLAKLIGLYGYLWSQEVIQRDQIEQLEQVTEDNKVKVLGALGWGVAGLAVFGPAGAAAGAILGGRGKKITFICTFKNGRKLFGSADIKTWADLQAARFSASRISEPGAERSPV